MMPSGVRTCRRNVNDRRVRGAECGHLDVTRLQHHAVVRDVLGDQQFARVGTAFVVDPGLDVELVQLPKRLCHRFDALRAERVDRCRETGGPGVVEQIAVFEIMIGMVMVMKMYLMEGIGTPAITS